MLVTNHPELDHNSSAAAKFSRARPPGEFPLSFTFFSLVDFENGLKFTGDGAAIVTELAFYRTVVCTFI